jgi:hypothetical protein
MLVYGISFLLLPCILSAILLVINHRFSIVLKGQCHENETTSVLVYGLSFLLTDRKGKWKNRKIEQFHYLRCRIPSYTIGITFLLPMMFYFTPPAGIMLHHQGWNIFRPLGMYSSSSSHPDGTLFESPVRWRGEKRKLPPPLTPALLPGGQFLGRITLK